MIKFLCSYILILLSINVHAQKILINGKVSDSTNLPVPSAGIIVKDKAGNTVVHTFSDENGSYQVAVPTNIKLQMSVNSMWYEPQVLELEGLGDNAEFDFILTPKLTELKAVSIESRKSITVKKDTIIFDVKSFLQGNEQVVEDLLKKIPGITVTADGSILAGNQEVEKVMIDGEDFFEKGYRILTKNMPVNPIEKVELYQNYSNNKHLKDIENSDKVALNLTLKDDARRVWFGNVKAGYGLLSPDRYELRSNLINFGKRAKYYFLSSLNNTGDNATGEIEHLIRPNRRDEPGGLGDDHHAASLLNFGMDFPNLKQKRINFNNAEMLSLNSIFKVSSKLTIKGLGFVNTDENDLFRKRTESVSTGTTAFVNNEDYNARIGNLTGYGKIDLIYDMSKTRTLEYTGRFNNTETKNRSALNFNNELLRERLKGTNQLIDQRVLYTNKLKSNEVLLLAGRYIDETTPQNYSVNQYLFDDLFGSKADGTKQFAENQMQYVGVEAHILKRRHNGDLFELKFGNELRIDHLDTRFALVGDQLNAAPEGYQNKLRYTGNDLYLSTKYRLKLRDVTLLAQSDFHQVFNSLRSIDIDTQQSPFFIVPKVGLDWKLNDKHKLLTSYSYNTSSSELADIYGGYIQTGYRSFAKGLSEINQLNVSNAVLNYTYGNWGDKLFSNTLLLYSYSHNFYSTNALISQNFSQSEKIIVHDREFLSLSSSIDRYFKPIKTNLKLTVSYTATNYKNRVNSSGLREIKSRTTEYGMELRSGFKGFFNYHVGSKWNFSGVTSTIENSFTNNFSFVDLSFMVSDAFNVQVQGERYFFGNQERGSHQYYFLDAEARYTVIENKLIFSLSGNNLFNTDRFQDYSITDISIMRTEYRLIPRYVLLKAEYRF